VLLGVGEHVPARRWRRRHRRWLQRRAHQEYAKLLRAFWDTHDPTTLNRQGPDYGDQYRSEIFTFTPEQDAEAHASLAAEQKAYDRPITTRIEPLGPFYIAEGYHQQYDEKTGRESCPLPRRHGS
jgi:peptide-methionine (S)-S-oxide reductase